MTYTYTCPNCNSELEYEFKPGYAAPFCQNHDSPAFSDPGEPDDVEGPDVCGCCDHDIDMDRVIELASEKFADSKQYQDKD